MESQFIIQKSSYQQIWPIASNWANSYGFYYGIYDWKPIDKQFTQTAFVGKLNGDIIATIAGPIYKQIGFAFISIYYVDKKYQKQGYGIKMFTHCMQNLKFCKTIGLEAAQSQCQNYAKWGFKFYINHHNFVARGIKLVKKNQYIIPLSQISFQQLDCYDRTIFPSSRSKFLKQWIKMPESQSLVYYKDNTVNGYGVIRKTLVGYKIGPMYADSAQIACQIFDHLIDFPIQNSQIQIWVPGYHQEAIKIFRQKCGKQNSLSFQMWTNGAPQGSKSMKKYSLTSNQLG